MLIAAKKMYGIPLEGADGRVGTLSDILFDDNSWRLRHLVVNLDRWFLGQQVLLDPNVIERMEWSDRKMLVHLTKEQARQSPNVDTDLPVARREIQEAAHLLVWEAYWTSVLDTLPEMEGDPHLRSTKMLTGLHLHCTDGQLGHVVDFLIDDQQWSVGELLVDTRNWWPGKRVLIEPSLVERIDWVEREIWLSLPRGQVEDRPAFEYDTPIESQLV
jgi:hypothetical protein